MVHALRPRLRDDRGRVFGGRAKDRPYPGSTTVSTVNGAVVGMVNALATELAPIRVNAIHPGIVGDSPFWSGKPAAVLEGTSPARRPGGWRHGRHRRTRSTSCSRTASVNAVKLDVDGGWLLT